MQARAFGLAVCAGVACALVYGALRCVRRAAHAGAVATGLFDLIFWVIAAAVTSAAGAVSGGDMTTEAAVAKLYYLFSKGLDASAVKEKMGENLRGERSDSLT